MYFSTLERNTTVLLAAALAAVISTVAWGDGHNLVVNPTFSDGINGWEVLVQDNASWDSPDAGGESEFDSGSARLSDDTTGNGGVWRLLAQCIEVTGGTTYEFGGQILLPFGQPEGTAGYIWVSAFSEADCTGSTGISNSAGSGVEQKWIVVKQEIELPENINSVQVSVGIQKAVDEENFAQINADNVFLSAAGETLLPINEHLAGIWYNTNTPGQGKVADISTQINLFFAGWYTWTTVPGEIDWMILQGGFRGDQAEVKIYRSTGGVFNDPEPVETQAVGDAIFRARTCTDAELLFKFDGEQDYSQIDLTRLGPAPLDCID